MVEAVACLVEPGFGKRQESGPSVFNMIQLGSTVRNSPGARNLVEYRWVRDSVVTDSLWVKLCGHVLSHDDAMRRTFPRQSSSLRHDAMRVADVPSSSTQEPLQLA